MSDRTVLITNGNLLSMTALGPWMVRHGRKLAAVFRTTRLPSQRSNLRGVWRMFRRSGWAYTHFKLWTNVQFPRGIRRRGLPADVPALADALGLDCRIVETTDINSPEALEQLTGLEPEIILSFSATQRFCEELLRIPTRTILNAHYAILPQFAGLSPYFWYAAHGRDEAGSTLHVIEPALDTGPIVEQRTFPIPPDASVLRIAMGQVRLISPMLNNFYDGVTHESQAKPQDLTRRSYFGHPTRKQMRQFRKQGGRLIDAESRAMWLAEIDSLVELMRDGPHAAPAGGGSSADPRAPECETDD